MSGRVGRPLVYRALELLESRGLIEPVGTERGARGPNRSLFKATPRGREELARWLSEPVDHVRDVRSLLLLKLVLLERAGLDNLPLLEAQRELTVPAVAALEARLRRSIGTEHVFVRFRLETTRSVVCFIDGMLEERLAPAERRGGPQRLALRTRPAVAFSGGGCRAPPRSSELRPTVIVIDFHVAVPDGLVTVNEPVFAFGGTVIVIFAGETTLNFAGTPWNVTEVVPLKFVPDDRDRRPGLAPSRARPCDRRHGRRDRQEAVLDACIACPAGLSTLSTEGLRGRLVRALRDDGHRVRHLRLRPRGHRDHVHLAGTVCASVE